MASDQFDDERLPEGVVLVIRRNRGYGLGREWGRETIVHAHDRGRGQGRG